MGTQTTAPATPRRATLGHRRSVAKLTKAQLAKLREAFRKTMALADERGYSYFAGWHGEPFNWCEHHTDLFLPWHRAYLYDLELALQSQVPGVRLPWWDWTTAKGIPRAYTAEEDPDGAENPLLIRTVTVYRSGQAQQAPPRDPGGVAQIDPPPYADRWAQAMQAPTFRSFSAAIEGIHDDVHVWVGGIMQDIQWAAYDPLFFAHHTMVDRAWRIWQHQHPGALPPASIIDRPLRPNGMTVRQTLDVTKLGYEYAGTASHAPGDGVMQRWTSEPLAIPKAEGAPFVSAELSFEDLRHDGPSFVVRVHLNDPDADEDTAPAAGFTVFAHGDCWGDVGHCEIPTEPVSAFDRRPDHPLTPRNLSVDVTAALQALGDVDEVTVTALAFPVDDSAEPLRFGRLTLVTYD